MYPAERGRILKSKGASPSIWLLGRYYIHSRLCIPALVVWDINRDSWSSRFRLGGSWFVQLIGRSWAFLSFIIFCPAIPTFQSRESEPRELPYRHFVFHDARKNRFLRCIVSRSFIMKHSMVLRSSNFLSNICLILKKRRVSSFWKRSVAGQ